MKHFTKAAAVVVLTAALISLSGCYSGGIEQYFSPPQPAEEYLQLQTLIDAELTAGSEYAAPTQGSYRQSVQFIDLNDDSMDEAIVYLRGSDGLLHVNIYLSVNSVYRKVLTISGEGRSIGSVDFADMDNDGSTDFIVAWQLTGSMNLLCVYSLENWTGNMLLGTDSTDYLIGDLTGNGREELLVLRSVSNGAYMADMYSLEGGEPRAVSAALSAGIVRIERARIVRLSGGSAALLAESTLENGDLVTDVLSCREGSLVNLTLNRSTGVSETARHYSLVYAQDIDGDGVTEIPHPQQLYSQTGEVFFSVAWYKYDAFGRAGLVMSTFHSVSDGWYFVLPNEWTTGFTVRRSDDVPGEHAAILSQLGVDGSVNDLVAFYTITGENRSERARLDSRMILLEETATIYAAQILSSSVDQAMISRNFHRIYSDWSS